MGCKVRQLKSEILVVQDMKLPLEIWATSSSERRVRVTFRAIACGTLLQWHSFVDPDAPITALMEQAMVRTEQSDPDNQPRLVVTGQHPENVAMLNNTQLHSSTTYLVSNMQLKTNEKLSDYGIGGEIGAEALISVLYRIRGD